MDQPASRRRLAIVLLNLGGPDAPEAVRPFLVNLFTDPAILRVPGFVRPWLGRLIAWRRTKPARENYALLGGRSPLLELTEQQARALEAALADDPGLEAKCFVAMRYWHPMSDAAARAVAAWAPDEILLLPLYPQFSTTTTGSSLAAWTAAADRAGLGAVPATTLCCWHSDPAFAQATAAILRRAHDEARARLPAEVPLRLLFSAHGLPEGIVRAGDPYQWQVERSVAAVRAALGIPGLDHAICYQSRVTPQKWIGPSTEEEIGRAARDRVAVLVCPIAFVSEHSETLVELDVEYRHLAERLGVPGYFRAPAQNADPGFIAALAGLVRRARASGRALCSFAGGRQCPKPLTACPHGAARAAAPRDRGRTADTWTAASQPKEAPLMSAIVTRRTAAALLAAAVAPALAPSRLRAARPAAEAVLYRDPGCGCCGDYAAHLRQHGYAVRLVPTEDLARIKREQGVPEALESCHTMLLEGYVVEGHVPAVVVDRLLAERPAIRGISLPGMPPGSPGMPGRKAAPFTIYALPREAAGPPAIYAVE